MPLRYLVAGGLLANALPALSPVAPTVARGLRVRTRLADPGGVALTFDDGPHPQGTADTLDVLAGADVRATFFLVGEQVERRPGLAAEIVAAGHEVALHCYRHRNLLRLTPRQIRDDLRRGASVIQAATGAVPALHRPPYGIYSAAGLAVARRLGYRPLLWSRWGRDWAASATPASIAAELTSGAGGGDILLLHDADYYSAPSSWRRTVAALPRVIEELRRRDLPLVGIGETA